MIQQILIIFSTDKVEPKLANCHGEFLETRHQDIVPIIKNKAGNLSSGNNYRPIALANVMSKVFESLILLRCEQFLTTAIKRID